MSQKSVCWVRFDKVYNYYGRLFNTVSDSVILQLARCKKLYQVYFTNTPSRLIISAMLPTCLVSCCTAVATVPSQSLELAAVTKHYTLWDTVTGCTVYPHFCCCCWYILFTIYIHLSMVNPRVLWYISITRNQWKTHDREQKICYNAERSTRKVITQAWSSYFHSVF